MSSNMFKSFAWLIYAIVGSMPLAAASPVTLESDVKVERTINEGGKEAQVLAPPIDVVPGDRLVFETNYANNSDDAVENFVVTNPLPQAVALAEEDGSFSVSVDGGKSYAPSIAGLVIADAEAGAREATLADVTHIRWTIARIEAGKAGKVAYQGIVR